MIRWEHYNTNNVSCMCMGWNYRLQVCSSGREKRRGWGSRVRVSDELFPLFSNMSNIRGLRVILVSKYKIHYFCFCHPNIRSKQSLNCFSWYINTWCVRCCVWLNAPYIDPQQLLSWGSERGHWCESKRLRCLDLHVQTHIHPHTHSASHIHAP